VGSAQAVLFLRAALLAYCALAGAFWRQLGTARICSAQRDTLPQLPRNRSIARSTVKTYNASSKVLHGCRQPVL